MHSCAGWFGCTFFFFSCKIHTLRSASWWLVRALFYYCPSNHEIFLLLGMLTAVYPNYSVFDSPTKMAKLWFIYFFLNSILNRKQRTYQFDIVLRDFNVQIKNNVMLLEHWPIFYTIVAQARSNCCVMGFFLIAFNMHRWAKNQCHQRTKTAYIRHLRCKTKAYIATTWISITSGSCDQVFLRQILWEEIKMNNQFAVLKKKNQQISQTCGSFSSITEFTECLSIWTLLHLVATVSPWHSIDSGLNGPFNFVFVLHIRCGGVSISKAFSSNR